MGKVLLKFGQPSGRIKMNECDWAYLAGVIDSDGCIQASKCGRSTSHYYQLSLHVIQKKMPIIEFLHKNFGGGISLVWRTHSKTRYYFRFVLTGVKCSELLKRVLPYLKNKREQALLGIELQSIQLPRGNSKKLP